MFVSFRSDEHHDSWPPTLQSLRHGSTSRCMAAETLRALDNSIQKDSSGEFCNSRKRVVKSGWEWTGGDDSSRQYVQWPQEATIHRPDPKWVKYDELSHPQWVVGLVVIQARPPDPTVRDNMGQYLAELFQDVLDFGYNTAKGAYAVVLSAIKKDGRHGKTSVISIILELSIVTRL